MIPDRICPMCRLRFLDLQYKPDICPRCLHDELLIEADLQVRVHTAARRWDLVERVMCDFGTSADLLLAEDPDALARHSGRAVA